MQDTLINVVQSTTNYQQFDFLTANRDLNRSHIERIKKSFEEDGNFTAAQPILVNESMQVIDGQHRLVACTELNLPVYFTVVNKIGITQARKMNLLHRKWGANDFLKTYADEGRRSYIEFQKLVEDYPDFSFSVVLACVIGHQGMGQNSAFRRGELEIFDIAVVRKRLESLSELIAVNPRLNTQPMAYAYLRALQADGFKQNVLLEQVALRGGDISSYSSVVDNLRQLEAAYNHNRGVSSRIRFF